MKAGGFAIIGGECWVDLNIAPVSKRTNKVTAILEEAQTGFSVYCPAVPGCVSQGGDRQVALANIKEVIESILGLPDVPLPLLETPAMIAEEIREVPDGRERDGLEYARVFLEEVEVPIMPHFDGRKDYGRTNLSPERTRATGADE